MLKNGIKPKKSNFIISYLVNIFLLIRMFLDVTNYVKALVKITKKSKASRMGRGHTL